MSNISNKNGRAFESILAQTIQDHLNTKLTERAKNDQLRDTDKVNNLPIELEGAMRQSSRKIVNWLSSNFTGLSQSLITLDRLPDSESKKGNPTDIQINFNNTKINLSLKHNHKAFKHQRPSSLIQQFDIEKNTAVDKQYRKELKKISNDFYTLAKKTTTTPDTFSKLTDLQKNIVDKKLYEPTCTLVKDYINQLYVIGGSVGHFFSFLVGTEDYYKVMVDNAGDVEVHFFEKSNPPQTVTAELTSNNHIKLTFSNKWIFDMRLHTASSRTKGCDKSTCSLKFDTQGEKIMPKEQIRL